MERVKMIWITPKFPLGMPDGARHATCVLVRNLTKLGIHIDLICLLPHGERADADAALTQLGVASCTLIPRSGSIFMPLPTPKIPLTFRTFAAGSVKQALQKKISFLLSGQDPQSTFVLFDGLHTFSALDPDHLQKLASETHVIYRAHNVETMLWEQCAANTSKPWLRWLYHYQASLVRYWETLVAQSVSLVAPVSEEDGRRFHIIAPGSHVSCIPIGIDFPSDDAVPQVPMGTNVFKVLFIGRLDWTPNKNGLMWFLEKVWPIVTKGRRNISLTIAGVGDGEWLRKYSTLPAVQFLGKVDQLAPLYQECALTIAPIFQGSGTRVKILESARFARPTLSTALGAEGSGLVPGLSYYRADNHPEWVRALVMLTSHDCRATGFKAFQDAKSRLEGGGIAERFIATVDGLRVHSARRIVQNTSSQTEVLLR